MEKIISLKAPRILKSKKILERELNVKISHRGKEVYIDGSPENEFIARKVIEAINFGFSFSDALSIKDRDFEFEVLNIKDYARSHNLERVRGRIIGKGGKTKKTLSRLTNCVIEIQDNFIGIIGPAECIYNAEQALISLIKGSKHANVYSYLEKHQIKPIWDYGLKKDYKKI